MNGKIIRHTKIVHGTKVQAKIEFANFITEIKQGTVIESKSITFKKLTLSTYRKISRYVRKLLQPFFKHNHNHPFNGWFAHAL